MTTSAPALAVAERVVGHGAAAFEAVRSRLAVLGATGIDGLLVPTRVTLQPGDVVAVTERDHGGTTLREILDARGGLRAGECVWWASEVARTVAALHKAGIIHGAINADAVVIAGDRVILSRLVDGAETLAAADDIRDLGRLLDASVRDDEAARVRAWTEPMGHEQPEARPSAAMVARALPSCASAEPVQIPAVGVARAMRRQATSPSEVVPLPEARWWRVRHKLTKRLRFILPAIAVVAAVVVASAALSHDGSTSVDRAGASLGEGGHTTERPAQAAVRLIRERLAAMERADAAALVELTAPGGPARRDAEQTASLFDAGRLTVTPTQATGMQPRDIHVEVGHGPQLPLSGGATAMVRVDYSAPAYAISIDGVSREVASMHQRVELTLVWSDSYGWTVVEAAQAADAT